MLYFGCMREYSFTLLLNLIFLIFIPNALLFTFSLGMCLVYIFVYTFLEFFIDTYGKKLSAKKKSVFWLVSTLMNIVIFTLFYGSSFLSLPVALCTLIFSSGLEVYIDQKILTSSL